MLVDEADAALQAAQAALHAAQYVLRHFVVGLLHLALEVRHHRADRADDGDDEGAVRDGAQVVSDRGANCLLSEIGKI